MKKNYKLTDDQFDMIRSALERYYYTCRGDSDLVKYLEPLDELENSLIKQNREQVTFEKEMCDIISECYYDITGENPVDSELLEIGIKIKELYYHDAMKWDWDDTEVRDNVYVWIQKQIEKGLI
ncbi:hypothetical protein NXG04_07845 [Klebsiella pneumoniae]|nr:hypothetical protein [Klebsiella pneumoniae]MDS7714467.1 hypothetical protein [Klebsiella pneumoniae]